MCFPLKKTPGKPQALPEIFRKREFHNNKYCCICQYIFLSCSSAAMPETGRPTLLYQAACDIPHFLTHPALLTNFPAAGDAPCSVLPLSSRPQSFPPEKKGRLFFQAHSPCPGLYAGQTAGGAQAVGQLFQRNPVLQPVFLQKRAIQIRLQYSTS